MVEDEMALVCSSFCAGGFSVLRGDCCKARDFG